MSYANIPYTSPQNFVITPTSTAVPLSVPGHVPVSQVLTGTVALTASQCLSPLILQFSGTSTVTLPDAYTLSVAFGNTNLPSTVTNLIPFYSQIPETTVQVGDVFVIPLYDLVGSGACTWLPGTGGSGTHGTLAYASDIAISPLKIQFTAVGTDNNTTSYVLS
jgi:hypothetical protein